MVSCLSAAGTGPFFNFSDFLPLSSPCHLRLLTGPVSLSTSPSLFSPSLWFSFVLSPALPYCTPEPPGEAADTRQEMSAELALTCLRAASAR